MARIAPKENFLQTLKERNNFLTRLYGIPRQASTVILFQELKHLKAKICYIPKCSISGKNRSFAIISFESQKELNKACTSTARYQNIKLTWSKSDGPNIMSQDEMNSNTLESMFSRSNPTQISINKNKRKENQFENNDDIRYKNNCSHQYHQQNQKWKGKDKMKVSIFEGKIQNSSYFSSNSPFTISSPMSIIIRSIKQYGKRNSKGRNRQNRQKRQEESTTNKLIALIIQISSRLDHIENSIGTRSNCF